MKIFNIILGVYAFFNGLYCIFYPEENVLGIGWIIAVLLALWGISSIAEYCVSKKNNKELAANGSIGLILGIAAMAVSVLSLSSPFFAGIFAIIITLCLALGIIVKGVMELVDNSKQKKNGKASAGTVVAGLFHLIAGVFGLISISLMSENTPMAIGIMLLIVCVAEFSSVFGKDSGDEQSEIW